MSLLTGERTTADAHALGPVEYMAWPAATLGRLRTRNPLLWSKIQSVLGHDLVEKIRRAAAPQGGGGGAGASVGSSAGVTGA